MPYIVQAIHFTRNAMWLEESKSWLDQKAPIIQVYLLYIQGIEDFAA